jgi:MarR family transcriptional regulator, organic hydroperoxide resistance regulator
MTSSWFEADPERMPLGKLLSRTGQSLHRFYQRTVAAHGMTSTSMGVLAVLADADAVSHRELAGRVGVTPATLTPVIDALEGAGELVRERDAVDRRTVRLSITPAGRERLGAAAGDVTATVRDRMPDPAPQDRQVIRDYLLAVLAAVDDEPPT